MATSGQLIDTVQRCSGLPKNAVAYPYRVLRDKGVISKGKRGAGGAKVTARDAASILIAVGAWMPTRDVFQSWQAASNLIADSSEIGVPVDDEEAMNGKRIEYDYRNSGQFDTPLGQIPSLGSLDSQHSFFDCVTSLIIAVRDREIPDLLTADQRISIEVATIPTRPVSMVSIGLTSSSHGTVFEQTVRYSVEGKDAPSPDIPEPEDEQFKEQWHFGITTIEALGYMLRD
jgi:hypothetical protein